MKKTLLYFLAMFPLIFIYGQTWTEKIKLTPYDQEAEDRVGISVAIDSSYAVVGAYREDEDAIDTDSLSDAGSAYMYEIDSAGNWVETQKIVASDREEKDYFGWAVSLSGDYAILGADGEGSNVYPGAGAAYIFERDVSGDWIEVKKLVPATRIQFADFGSSVSIHGNYAIVGSPSEMNNIPGAENGGAAYLFERDNTGEWNLVQRIVANDSTEDAMFGHSVSIHNNVALIGAIFERRDASGANEILAAGAAYIFERDSMGIWNQVQKIVASDRAEIDFLGSSVSISENYALVGAMLEEEVPLEDAGAVYIFEKDSIGTWSQMQKIIASDADSMDYFGRSVSISGDLLVVGAYREDEGLADNDSINNAGAAYLFQRESNGNWSQIQKLVEPERGDLYHFGYSVSISGTDVIIGAYGKDESLVGGDSLNFAGAAYIFAPSSTLNITEKDNEPSFSIYPNPTQSHITVDVAQSFRSFSVIVTDLLGKIVFQQTYQDVNSVTFKIPGAAGVYSVGIYSSTDKSVVKKIVKK